MWTILAAALLSSATVGSAAISPVPQDEWKLDTEQADFVLALLENGHAGTASEREAWKRLLGSKGYVRLKEREAAIGHPFTDEDFRAFIADPSLARRAAQLQRTLADWRSADLSSAAARARAYLPTGTSLQATIYPVIKPRDNSFVFDLDKDPAIFLYVDPDQSTAAFANVVAHELHHIGLNAACRDQPDRGVNPQVAAMLPWFGAFGEGIAMLAAAGSPDAHPHASSPPEDRARWDADIANYDANFDDLVDFFTEVLEGRLTGPALRERAAGYYGVQGPWYTVGWRMATLIERKKGRAALIGSLCDPRSFLTLYNEAALDEDFELPLWPQSIIDALPIRP